MHARFILAALFAYSSANAIDVNFPAPPSNPNIIKDNYLGISWEISSFDTLWGKTPAVIPPTMQNYLSNIRERMSNSLRIRVGGSGMDISVYDPNFTDQMLNLTDPNAYFNAVPVKFGPLFFQILNGMADKVGSMQFIIGLSLRNIDPASLVTTRTLAAASEDMLGERLDALLLGNEPDFYGPRPGQDSYNLSSYISDVHVLVDDLQQAPSLINEPVTGGPTTCCGKWPLFDMIKAGLGDFAYKYYSVQTYPVDACSGDTPKNTNVTFFLDHSAVTSYALYEHSGVSLAKQQGTPVLLTEFNSVSCGGSSISDIFAMSLWTIDVALKFATNNYSGVYLHTREYGRKYNLFDPPTADTPLDPNWRTGSPYYTTLVLAETLSHTGSAVIDLDLGDSTSVSGVPTVGYAIYDSNATQRGKLVLINYDVQQTNQEQTYIIQPNLSKTVNIQYLLAPTVTERTNISWAGQTVGVNGTLGGQQYTESMECSNGCSVKVPGPGLAVVLFTSTSPDNFYGTNNSGAKKCLRTMGLWAGVLGFAFFVVLL